MAKRTLDVFDKLIGRLPGRLSLIVITGGALFSTLSGSTIANTAMLGQIMVPEMRARGYKNPMILGPIVGVGGLAMLIPPSALAVVYASLAQISVGKVLIAGAVPGFMLAVLYGLYVFGRSRLNPSIAPAYEVVFFWSSVLFFSVLRHPPKPHPRVRSVRLFWHVVTKSLIYRF
jgi:TRAP-type C4-dicarboxylate transport system permease large subunit